MHTVDEKGRTVRRSSRLATNNEHLEWIFDPCPPIGMMLEEASESNNNDTSITIRRESDSDHDDDEEDDEGDASFDDLSDLDQESGSSSSTDRSDSDSAADQERPVTLADIQKAIAAMQHRVHVPPSHAQAGRRQVSFDDTAATTRPRFALRVLLMVLILLLEIGWVGVAFYYPYPALWQSNERKAASGLWNRFLAFGIITLVFSSAMLLLMVLDYVYKTGMRCFWFLSMVVCVAILGVAFWGTAGAMYLYRAYADTAREYIAMALNTIQVLLPLRVSQQQCWSSWIDGVIPAPQ